MERRAGILLHPTSLPGPDGTGNLGQEAHRFLAWLEQAGQRIWQMLPTGPVDGWGSPYASPSALARNPLLISPDRLLRDGWLRPIELPPDGAVNNHAELVARKMPALRFAAERVARTVALPTEGWRADWALFRALQDEQGPSWPSWAEPLRDRDARALDDARTRLADDITAHLALQWLFEQQWTALRQAAAGRGIALWGDLPIFVGAESCDTWVHRELFRLDEAGRPTVVSGVPPDAFSPEGQRWGHAHYDEAAHRRTGHAWWLQRVEALLELFDAARIDHFRGFAEVWEVPVDAPDATTGQWVEGPGRPLLDALRLHFGHLPLIAEDLGIITPDVTALRDDYGLPGMAILQFAFGSGADNPYLPHNHRRNLVVFPGTHDNNTARGWFLDADAHCKRHVRRYLRVDGADIGWDLLRAAYRSVADTAIVPMQDVLRLTDARMNTPGQAEGNWHWRMPPGAMTESLATALADEARLTGR